MPTVDPFDGDGHVYAGFDNACNSTTQSKAWEVNVRAKFNWTKQKDPTPYFHGEQKQVSNQSFSYAGIGDAKVMTSGKWHTPACIRM